MPGRFGRNGREAVIRGLAHQRATAVSKDGGQIAVGQNRLSLVAVTWRGCGVRVPSEQTACRVKRLGCASPVDVVFLSALGGRAASEAAAVALAAMTRETAGRG